MKQHTTEIRNNRMEDFILHSRTACDRCGNKRPDGSNGLGWLQGRLNKDGKWDWYGFDYDAKMVDICPDCFKSIEERSKAQQQDLQYK